jgi:hypothetical protein
MEGFHKFLEANANKEAKESLKKLPAAHQALIKGYKFKFEDGCNLKGYPDAIGLIHLDNPKKKLIQVAAPWRHSREFTMFHEIGHLVYEKLMDKNLRKKWNNILKTVKLHKDAAKEKNEEELFCHFYAQHYTFNKVIRYDQNKLDKFIASLT